MTDIKDTSQDYDHCIGVRNKEEAPGTLADFLGIEDVGVTDEKQAWEELWKGMPTFNNKKVVPFRSLTINFINEENFDRFVERLGFETITKKTKTIWYPEVPREENSTMRFIDEDDL
jgi:hypothetical protein